MHRLVGLAGTLTCLLLAACNSLVGYGPMAVTDSSDRIVFAALGGSGELRIEAACVYLDDDSGRKVGLAFRRDQVSWDPSRRAIAFDDFELGEVELLDGSRIEVGGGSIDPAGPRRFTWVAPPDASCPVVEFEVHTIGFL